MCHPRNFKTWAKISKSNSQVIVPKFLYPQNQHDLLNHCQIFKIKNRPHKKVIPNAVPGIQPNYSLTLKTYGPKTKASSKNLKPKKVKQEALVQKHAMVP